MSYHTCKRCGETKAASDMLQRGGKPSALCRDCAVREVVAVSAPPWFSPGWRATYARLLAQIRKIEAAAVAAGRKIRP
jgi:hypothetical protein